MGTLSKEQLEKVYAGENIAEETKALKDLLYPKLPDAPHRKALQKVWYQLQYNRAAELWLDFYRGFAVLKESDFSGAYRVSVAGLQKRASYRRKPEITTYTVTAYTSWIYSLYLSKATPEQLQKGKQGEQEIARHLPAFNLNGFKLIYKDPLEEKPKPLKIAVLQCGKQPLWGVPDLVYEDTESGTLYIIERKTVGVKTLIHSGLPSDGWPNLRAQLWAYSHIDVFQSYDNIVLIGEAWIATGRQLPKRVAVWRWSKSDKQFDQENLALFKAYGGTRLAPT